MTEVPFHTTRMGVRFHESTLPELVRQVSRLADALERLADSRERVNQQETEHEPEDRRTEDPQPPHA